MSAAVLAETYTGLMTDAPHLLFELTMEALTGLVAYPLGRLITRRVHRRLGTKIHADIDAAHGVQHDTTLDKTPSTR